MDTSPEQLNQIPDTAQEYRDRIVAEGKSIRAQLIQRLASDLKRSGQETINLLRGIQNAYQSPDCETIFTKMAAALGKDPDLDEGAVAGLIDSRHLSLAELDGLPLLAKGQVLSLYAQEKIYNTGSKEHGIGDWKSLKLHQKLAHAGKYLFSRTSTDYGSAQEAWKEYVATLPIHSTRFTARPEIGVEASYTNSPYTIASTAFEVVQSLREIGPHAKAAGQPIAQVEYSPTKKSKRHQVDLTNEIPILFFKTNHRGDQVGLLMYAYQNDTLENFAKRYSEKANNQEAWYPTNLYDSAVLAVNVDVDGNLFNKDDANQAFDAPRERHPCLVISFAKNAQGESELQLVADHYVLDGMLLNAIINAPTEENKDLIGLRKRLLTLPGFIEKQKTQVKSSIESENYNGVSIAELHTTINPSAELCAWSAAFFYQTMVETMQEHHVKPWQNLTKSLGLNITFSKHELQPLSVGGVGLQDTSAYRPNTWEYNHRHIIGMINSMYKFKVDKDICEGNDPFDNITQVSRVLATVTRSEVPDTLSKVLNEVVRHKGMESVRAVLAFPPTCIIENIGMSTQHETVVGRDLPNIVVQRGVEMMRYTLSVDPTSRFISSEQLPIVTELMALYTTELMAMAKEAVRSEQKPLSEVNDKIEELRLRMKSDITTKLVKNQHYES